MRTWKTGSRLRAATRVGAVLSLAAGAVLVAATPSYATPPDPIVTVSPTKGPSGGGNTMVLTTSGGADFGTTGQTTLGVQFSYNACSATYIAGVTPAGTGTTLSAGVVSAVTSVVGTSPDLKKLTVTVPAGVVAPGAMTSASYFICVYAGTVIAANGTPSVLTHSTATAAYTVQGGQVTLSQGSGITGGNNNITVTTSTGTVTPASGIQFQWAGTANVPQTCAVAAPVATPVATTGNPPVQTAGVIATPPANITLFSGSTTSVKVKVPADVALAPGQNISGYNVCIYATASANAALIAGTAVPYQVAGTSLSLGNVQGPATTINTIIATVPNGIIPAGSYAQAVQSATGTRGSCPATYTTQSTPQIYDATPPIRNLAPNRVAITLPSLTNSNSPTTDYWICIYSGNTNGSSSLIAGSQMPYTIAPLATLTSITPSAGSSLGGTQVTLVGSNFQSATQVSVGGTPVQISYIAPNGQTLIGNVPGHTAGGPFTVSVTTASGTVNLPSAFTFTNGIAVTPNFAPNTKITDLDVVGIGFASLSFAHTEADSILHTNDAGAHVYLVDGTYDPNTSGQTPKVNGQQGECANVLTVSDIEVVCQLDLTQSMSKTAGTVSTGAPLPDGTYTVTVVNNGAIGPASYTKTVISSGSTFTVAPY